MVLFIRDGCFTKIRLYKEDTEVNFNRLHGRIRLSCPAETSRESPGTPWVGWIRGDAYRILAVSLPCEIKLSHSCKQVPCKRWPEMNILYTIICVILFQKGGILLLPRGCLLTHAICANRRKVSWIGRLINCYIYTFAYMKGNEGELRKFLRGERGATKFFRKQKGGHENIFNLLGGHVIFSKFWSLKIPFTHICKF